MGSVSTSGASISLEFSATVEGNIIHKVRMEFIEVRHPVLRDLSLHKAIPVCPVGMCPAPKRIT